MLKATGMHRVTGAHEEKLTNKPTSAMGTNIAESEETDSVHYTLGHLVADRKAVAREKQNP
jgi:hypothetical protein